MRIITVRRKKSFLKAGEKSIIIPMIFNRSSIVCILLALTTITCKQSGQPELQLKRSGFKGVDEIDTIEAYPERGLYILQVIRNGTLGRFSTQLAFEKLNQAKGEKLRYELAEQSDYRVSKDFISLVDTKLGELNWGWFQVLNGKVIERLPGAEKIHDSLKEANRQYFIGEKGGYFIFYDNGRRIKTLNYGNFITRHRDLSFDSLDYKLYKVAGDSLIIAAKSGNDLFTQKDGVYFIPSPGYNVKTMHSKVAILNLIDSVSRSSSPPNRLFIKSLQ